MKKTLENNVAVLIAAMEAIDGFGAYVFHANKKDSRRFDRIERKAIKTGTVVYSQSIVGASNPHTSIPSERNASNETLPGANAH